MSSSEPAVLMKSGRDAAVKRRGHPWIYSQAVEQVRGEPASGELLPVLCADGSPLGWGFFSPNSLIAVRIVSFGEKPPGAKWIEERIEAAYSFRKSLPLDSDGLRLVNAEGDFIPGLIVDMYADTAVLSIHIRALEALVGRIASAVSALFPGVNVYLKRDEHYARVEKLALPSGYIDGTGDGTTTIREGKLKILVDFARGQKTGYYLDQRENRRLAALYSGKKKVLNLFSYTGGFALHAVKAGAVRAVSVETSRGALDIAEKSMRLNPDLPSGAFQWQREDVFSFLEKSESHDLIVVDPPPFARRRSEIEGAIRGYVSLNQQVLRLLAPGGYAFTFSCSGAVDRETFRRVLMEAAHRSNRRVRFIRELHADADHPVAAEHPEGEYLKGWLIHAE